MRSRHWRFSTIRDTDVMGAKHVTTSWLIVTFGEWCRNGLMLQSVMRLERFEVISARNPCTPRDPAQKASPKVTMSQHPLPPCGMKPAVLDHHILSDSHTLTRTY